MFSKESLQKDFAKLPDLPGVYMFIDDQDQVLYVGKAKSLRDRVGSYPASSAQKTAALLALAEHIDFRLTKSELAAMILEAKLIQNHQPQFNVLLRGGQPFLYFILSKADPAELILTRSQTTPGKVVAQFLNKSEARALYATLLKNFQLRLCHKKISGGCLYWHLGQCAGICRGDFDKKAYIARLDLAVNVLKRGARPLLGELERKQDQAVQTLDFERARAIEKQIKTLEQCDTILSDPATTDKLFASRKAGQKDIWILWENNAGLQLLSATGATVVRRELWALPDEDPASYLQSYYSSNQAPESIFTNFKIAERKILQEFIAEWQKLSSVVIFDKIGEHPSDLLSLALLLAKADQNAWEQTPAKLSKICASQKPINTIDCFDISHKSGLAIVAACVRFKNGQFDPGNLRLFKMQTVVQNDDYASLAEAVKRRYKNGQWPDMILIDGGKGQRNAVLPYTGAVPVVALAKREERLFCEKNLESGLKLNVKEPWWALLIALRDQTHKRALLFHKKTFDKKVFGDKDSI